ncbi:hypothetical protein [uncultured Winogradskyella sp.]|uniref:hypothetical protein n=1 Tax=uncultured Winogradskyella sp. TaxID=395353 RepID=UPI0026296DE0|nr:hypothetical protein [uncultured Winogradskyella sp.]
MKHFKKTFGILFLVVLVTMSCDIPKETKEQVADKNTKKESCFVGGDTNGEGKAEIGGTIGNYSEDQARDKAIEIAYSDLEKNANAHCKLSSKCGASKRCIATITKTSTKVSRETKKEADKERKFMVAKITGDYTCNCTE